MQRLIAWIRFFNADGVEDIEEIEVDLKGVYEIRESKIVSRALEIAGMDVVVTAPGRAARHVKAIVMPYKSRMRNRNIPELPDSYIDLGELNDDYYYLVLAADDVKSTDKTVHIKDTAFGILNHGSRFLHNDVLYTWCIVQRITQANASYYDDVSDSPCAATRDWIDGLPS